MHTKNNEHFAYSEIADAVLNGTDNHNVNRSGRKKKSVQKCLNLTTESTDLLTTDL